MQSLNGNVFINPRAVMDNIEKIEKAFSESDEKIITVPHYLTANGKKYIESDGEAWRLYEYTEQFGLTENRDYMTGYAFGKFINILNNTDLKLETTIENFHDFNKYHDCFKKLSGTERPDDPLKKILSEVFTPELPRRNIHNDAKSDNIIFGEKITIIDLDTSMSGFVAIDYGDMIRSGGDIRNITQGFADGLGGLLTREEINSLYYGILYITGELAFRYCIDSLAEERYFITKTPKQCLTRVDELLRQFKEYERNSGYIQNIINKSFRIV